MQVAKRERPAPAKPAAPLLRVIKAKAAPGAGAAPGGAGKQAAGKGAGQAEDEGGGLAGILGGYSSSSSDS
jgi:hypothetical protein